MNFDDFEKIRRDLGGHLRDLEETLRDGVRSLYFPSGDTSRPSSVKEEPQQEFARRRPMIRGPRRSSIDGSVSLRDLVCEVFHRYRWRSTSVKWPPYLTNWCRQQTRDGRERGRAAFTHLVKGNLVVGDTAVGTEQSVTNSTRPPRSYEGQPIYPVMDMHTHPRGPFEPAHFVRSTLVRLICRALSARESFVTLMISRGVSLMAIRSLTTPRSSRMRSSTPQRGNSGDIRKEIHVTMVTFPEFRPRGCAVTTISISTSQSRSREGCFDGLRFLERGSFRPAPFSRRVAS